MWPCGRRHITEVWGFESLEICAIFKFARSASRLWFKLRVLSLPPRCSVFTPPLETLSHGTYAHKLFRGLPRLCCFIAAIERHHPISIWPGLSEDTAERIFIRSGAASRDMAEDQGFHLPLGASLLLGRHGWFIELSQTVYSGSELHAAVSRTFQLRESTDPG